MRIICVLLCVTLAACASDLLQTGVAVSEGEQPASRLLYPYESSQQCRGCHGTQYQQYENSMHAKAFSNPLFNAQYFRDVVPGAQRDPARIPEARACIACHAPAVFMNYTGLVTTQAQAELFETGVTCDFCHTLAGYADNGDYRQAPSGKKQGELQIDGSASHHAEYADFVQSSAFCGRCHNATNHSGLEVKSTYNEWRESSFGEQGLSCQECHMNRDGFLRNGSAGFDQGEAAHINIGGFVKGQKKHDKLYNHSFPGAHSISQLEDALLLEFKVGSFVADPDGCFTFLLSVNNGRAGHKMPSGSSDLRFMWLVVTATAADGTKIPVQSYLPLADAAAEYAIAGASADDAEILGIDVPYGSRLYRTVLVNAAGRQSLFQYDAVRSAFDNRLNAAEIRAEKYYMYLPPQFSGMVTLEAQLYYRGAPSSFTRSMQVPDATPVLVASQKKQLHIEAADAAKERRDVHLPAKIPASVMRQP